MILGIGTDITNKKRFESLSQNERFIKRLLTLDEIEIFNNLPSENRKINFIAKRFAGKEAFSKALGCGIGGKFQNKTFSFQSIEILNNEKGAPLITLLESHLKEFISSSFISFSDEENLVFCTVVLSK